MKEKFGYEYDPDFAETVELAFESGPRGLRSWARPMKIIVNIFVCVTQIGFSAIYFVFISSSLKQVRSGSLSSTNQILLILRLFILIVRYSISMVMSWRYIYT